MKKNELIKEEEKLNILGQDIRVLKLNKWILTILKSNGIFTIQDLLEYGLVKLLEIPELKLNEYILIKRKLEAFVMKNDAIKDMYLQMSSSRPLFKIPIQEFNISNNTIDILLKAGIDTAEKLLKCNDNTLKKMLRPSKSNVRRVLAIKAQISQRRVENNDEKGEIGLDSLFTVLELNDKVCDILTINHLMTIGDLIKVGLYGLVQKGINQSSAKVIWKKIEEVGGVSQEINDALEEKRRGIREKQDTYNNIPIRSLKKLHINEEVQYCLEDMLGLKTVGEMMLISEDDVSKLEYDKNSIKKALRVIKKVRSYYDNGSLEYLLDSIIEENVNLESSVSALNLTNKASDALKKINCTTIGQIVGFGGVDGLIIRGVDKVLAEEIWGQIEKASHIFSKIEEAVNIKKDEISEKQKEYQTLPLIEFKYINSEVYSCLKKQFGIENIGQLINLTEEQVYDLISNAKIANRIVRFIKKVKLYYNSGCLELLFDRVTDKEATVSSSIDVLNLTLKAKRGLAQIDISDIGKIIELGEYGLKKRGIRDDSIKHIWRQIQKLAMISPKIKEAMDEQEKRKEDAKVKYINLPIEKIQVLPLKYLIFLKKNGVKTVGEFVVLTEDDFIDIDLTNVKNIFKYIRTVRRLYNNADLEIVIAEPTPNLEAEWNDEILLGEEEKKTKKVFSLEYNRLKQNKEKLYGLDCQLIKKVTEAGRLFKEIASKGRKSHYD